MSKSIAPVSTRRGYGCDPDSHPRLSTQNLSSTTFAPLLMPSALPFSISPPIVPSSGGSFLSVQRPTSAAIVSISLAIISSTGYPSSMSVSKSLVDSAIVMEFEDVKMFPQKKLESSKGCKVALMQSTTRKQLQDDEDEDLWFSLEVL
ncbi:hypothetical protein EJ110_NYTH50326 [Nymphaea thermarum]|nr:hypothetical protein EJ110_NYTH50326 [Nymphaea thermarum]